MYEFLYYPDTPELLHNKIEVPVDKAVEIGRTSGSGEASLAGWVGCVGLYASINCQAQLRPFCFQDTTTR